MQRYSFSTLLAQVEILFRDSHSSSWLNEGKYKMFNAHDLWHVKVDWVRVSVLASRANRPAFQRSSPERVVQGLMPRAALGHP